MIPLDIPQETIIVIRSWLKTRRRTLCSEILLHDETDKTNFEINHDLHINLIAVAIRSYIMIQK